MANKTGSAGQWTRHSSDAPNGRVNIDADLVHGGDAVLSRSEVTLVEMTNGDICCTLRDDLLKKVRGLAETGRFDYLVIDSTGISEPLP